MVAEYHECSLTSVSFSLSIDKGKIDAIIGAKEKSKKENK